MLRTLPRILTCIVTLSLLFGVSASAAPVSNVNKKTQATPAKSVVQKKKNVVAKKTAKKIEKTTPTQLPPKKFEPSITAVSANSLGILPPTALGVPMVTYTITAGDDALEVSGVEIEQKGGAQLGLFDAVVVLDGGADGIVIGDAVLNSLGRARISFDPIILAPRTSRSLTLAADVGHEIDTYDGQMPALVLRSVTASALLTLPAEQFPLRVVSSAKIGSLTATRGGEDPVGQRTVYVNDTAIRFGAIRLSASSIEDVDVESITWRQVGSSGGSDIQNIRARVNGRWCAAEVAKREYTATCPEPVRVGKGDTLDVVLEGDIGTTGSNRTVRFDIAESFNITARGVRTGFYLPTYVGGNTSESDESTFNTSDGTIDGDSIVPYFYRGSTFTISPGAMISIGR